MQDQAKLSVSNKETIDLSGAEVYLTRNWLDQASSLVLYDTLVKDLAWTQPEVVVYGKRHRVPRLQCWQGIGTHTMVYSQTRFTTEPLHPALSEILPRLQQDCEIPLNSVLINYYRDGNDGMGWHADDERELGESPLIASLSLGADRNFDFRRKNDHRVKHRLSLRSGDLLVMAGDTQRYWQHALPKTKRVQEGRINLTFREIKMEV